jgi:hypothetical protein
MGLPTYEEVQDTTGYTDEAKQGIVVTLDEK